MQVTNRLWMMPTCSAPISVQQNNQFFLATGFSCFYNKIGANFTNQKTITVEGNDTSGGIISQGDFENQVLGTITVTHIKYEGISHNTGTFTNRGTITVSDSPMQALVYN